MLDDQETDTDMSGDLLKVSFICQLRWGIEYRNETNKRGLQNVEFFRWLDSADEVDYPSSVVFGLFMFIKSLHSHFTYFRGIFSPSISSFGQIFFLENEKPQTEYLPVIGA